MINLSLYLFVFKDNISLQSIHNLSANEGSFNIHIDKNRHYAHVTFDGEIGMEIINNAYMELILNPLFSHNMNVCNDYSKAFLLVSIQEIEKHSNFVAQYADQRGSTYKLALVSNETISTAFLNMYRVLISKSKVDCEQFSRAKSALRWLES